MYRVPFSLHDGSDVAVLENESSRRTVIDPKGSPHGVCAQILMGCGASMDDPLGDGMDGSPVKIKVNKPRRFDMSNGIHVAYLNHAKVAMHLLFAHYDRDASGNIEPNELYEMMLNTMDMKEENKVKADTFDEDEFDFYGAAAGFESLQESTGIPTLEDVHDMMYAIGVQPSANALVQGGELLLHESLFIEWMLGGMRRSKEEREEFAKENEIQKKMVRFLDALGKMISRNVASVEFLFSNGSDGNGGGFIESDELYAILYKARTDSANVEMRASLFGEDPKKMGTPPMVPHEHLESFVRALDPGASPGATPKLYEAAFVDYLLRIFSQGPQKRRTAMRADPMLVSFCGLLAFIEKNALPAITATEGKGGGKSPMRTIALSSLFYEYDFDNDNSLNKSEITKLLRYCAKKGLYKLDSTDEDAVEKFMEAFDKDNDGYINHDEFVDFMSSSMEISREDRIGQFGHYAVLQQFVFDLVILFERFLKFAVGELTNLIKATRQDQKGNKSAPVTVPELRRLIMSCADSLNAAGLPEEVRRGASKPDEEDVQNFIQFMDKNGDGDLQQGELIESVLRAILQSSSSRKKAAKKAKGDSRKEITGFLSTIRAEVQRRVLRASAGGLFRRFDKTMKGEMTEGGIIFMIEGIATEHGKLCPWEDYQQKGGAGKLEGDHAARVFGQIFMDTMDEDGDGLLQEEEFVTYMAKTMMKEKAAEEMRKAAGASFDDFDLEDGIDSMDPDLKRNLMNEMFHVIELELPFIGTT